MQYKNVKLFFGILSVLTRNKNQNIYLLFFFFKKESKMNKKTEKPQNNLFKKMNPKLSKISTLMVDAKPCTKTP